MCYKNMHQTNFCAFSKVKTLGEDDDDDGALAWVMKSRKLEEDKILAEKRVRFLF